MIFRRLEWWVIVVVAKLHVLLQMVESRIVLNLHFVLCLEYPIVKALYLIDPVNGDPRFAPESAEYPSAVRALTGKGWRIGITGEL